jgi:hypothetical protein
MRFTDDAAKSVDVSAIVTTFICVLESIFMVAKHQAIPREESRGFFYCGFRSRLRIGYVRACRVQRYMPSAEAAMAAANTWARMYCERTLAGIAAAIEPR